MRYSFFIVLLAASLLHPLNAWSENPQEDFGKSAVAQTLMKQAKNQEAAPVRTVSAPAASSPYEYHEDIPEDVDALMERVETQNSALVEEFEQLLQKDALNPDAPKWLGQIAEFHWQTAHYAYHHRLIILRKSQLLLQSELIFHLFLPEILFIVFARDQLVLFGVEYIIVYSVHYAAQIVSPCP